MCFSLSQLHNIAWYSLDLKDEYVQFLLVKHINKKGWIRMSAGGEYQEPFQKGEDRNVTWA